MALSKKSFLLRATTSATSLALVGTCAVVFAVAVSDAAYAGKGGKSEDRGAKSSVSKPIKSKAKPAHAVQAKTERKVEKVATKKVAKGNHLSSLFGVHPSELGALNAANASENARANAAPNSRVGRINTYAETVLASQILEDELAAALATVEGKTRPEKSSEEIAVDILEKQAEKEIAEVLLVQLQNDLANSEVEDPALVQQIADLTGSIATMESDLDALHDAQDTAKEFELVDQAESDLDAQLDEQRAALEAAANKTVTDEIEEAIQKILGIYRDPVVEPTPET